MKSEDLNLLAQLIYSMELAAKELEKAVDKGNIERIRKAKNEILDFQEQIAKITR